MSKKIFKTIIIIMLIISTIITEKELISRKSTYEDQIIAEQNVIIDMLDENQEVKEEDIINTLEESVKNERALIRQNELLSIMYIIIVIFIIKYIYDFKIRKREE